MAVTVVPMASLIIITTPFTVLTPDGGMARPWLRGAVQAVKLVGKSITRLQEKVVT